LLLPLLPLLPLLLASGDTKSLVVSALMPQSAMKSSSRALAFALLVLSGSTLTASAYQPASRSNPQPHRHAQASSKPLAKSSPSSIQAPANPVNALLAKTSCALSIAALSLLLSTAPAHADAASSAQIKLDALPPSSISIQIQDLPVVGKLISGTYTRVPDGSVPNPSIIIKSPTDKLKAIKDIATGGHLEFDVSGKIQTHLDVDVAADKAGVAKIRVASGLIPKLPFSNLASSAAGSPTGGRESPWNMVVNMGTGETYYYNEKTGVTQYIKPDRF
jgi:hypothetical protein